MPDKRKLQRAAVKYKERTSHHFSQGQKKRISDQPWSLLVTISFSREEEEDYGYLLVFNLAYATSVRRPHL
jgi:hypothetical protein